MVHATRIVATALVCLLLAGCIRPQQSDKIILRFASAEVNAEQLAITRTIIADFEKANPHVRVDCEFGITPRKILVQIAGGVGPDLFTWWYDLQPLITREAVADLAPLAAEQNFDWEVFYPYMVDFYRRDDAIYALPIQLKTYCLVYNKDAFDRAGLPYPDGTWTWEKYLEVAQQLTLRPERGPAEQFGNGPFAQFTDYVIRANGGDWLHKVGGEFKPDTPENRRAVELILALNRTASPRPEDNESFGGGSLSQAFLTGKVAMQIAPAWMMAMFTQSDVNWDVAPAPGSATSGGVVFDDGGIAMNSRCEHPREAFELLEFYASRKSMEYFASCRNGLSARRDSNEPFLHPDHPGMVHYLEAAEKATLPIKPMDPAGDGNYYRGIISKEFQKLYPLGEISVDEFFRRIEKRLNQPKPDIG